MKIYDDDPYDVCPMIAVHGCAECPLVNQCHRKKKEQTEEKEIYIERK